MCVPGAQMNGASESLMNVSQGFAMPGGYNELLAINQGPSTPVKYDEQMKIFVPNPGAGRPVNIRYKGFPGGA